MKRNCCLLVGAVAVFVLVGRLAINHNDDLHFAEKLSRLDRAVSWILRSRLASIKHPVVSLPPVHADLTTTHLAYNSLDEPRALFFPSMPPSEYCSGPSGLVYCEHPVPKDQYGTQWLDFYCEAYKGTLHLIVSPINAPSSYNGHEACWYWGEPFS